jgi:hypothetical protein
MVRGKWPGQSRDRQHRGTAGGGQHAHPHGAHLHGPADRVDGYEHHPPDDHQHDAAFINYDDHFDDHHNHRADHHYDDHSADNDHHPRHHYDDDNGAYDDDDGAYDYDDEGNGTEFPGQRADR